MSKFNIKSKGIKTENLAGGEAYSLSPKMEAVSILLTSFVSDQFYRSANETLEKLKELVKKIDDKQFLAKLAIYARTEFGMRSITHALAAELAQAVRGPASVNGNKEAYIKACTNQEWMRKFIDKVVYRPDDMLEILSYYFANYAKEKNGKYRKIPMNLKRGLSDAIKKFNGDTLAKYRGGNKELKLIDLVNLIHPIPSDKQVDAIKKLVKDELVSTDTWETKLTKAGQEAETQEEKEEFKKEAWKDLIENKKIKYFALLRNLRNIIEQAPEVLDKALEMLTDETLIKKSLVLPFRFLTAMDIMENLESSKARKVMVALNKAIDISCSNVPRFEGRTLVVLDTSGSMAGRPAQIGSLFAALLVKYNDADFITFSDDAKYQNLNILDSITTMASRIRFASGGTDFHSIFHTANKAYDRIIILSDMQGWIGYDTPVEEYNQYKFRTGANPFIYSIDLQGYGTSQFPESNIFCLAGFSDQIFKIMAVLERDKNALINEISKIVI